MESHLERRLRHESKQTSTEESLNQIMFFFFFANCSDPLAETSVFLSLAVPAALATRVTQEDSSQEPWPHPVMPTGPDD